MMTRNRERGAVLIFVMVITAVISLIGSAMVGFFSSTEARSVEDTLMESRVKWAMLGHATYVLARSRAQGLCAAGTVPTECGTAVAGVALDGPDALVFHAGDSRVYRLTAKGPSRLTRDHSLVQTLLDSGTITPETARIHPRRHQLLFGFGPVFSEHWRQRYASVCCVADRLAPSEAYLICSDGFVNAVSAQDMECLTGDVAAADLSALMERVIERARDNVSMCVVRQRRETAAGPAVGKP